LPKDILLDNSGDIYVGDTADISIKHSIRQDVKIRLQWFFDEWRFNPEAGIPYFEEVFLKNPNTDVIAQIFREEATKAEGVKEITNVSVVVDSKSRTATIKFTIITDYGSFKEEVSISV
jgi:hypothetical protein